MKLEYEIYAVDFDQTLAFGSWPLAEQPNTNLINKLVSLQAEGDKIILWTCRTGDRLDAAIKLCSNNGLHFDAIKKITKIVHLFLK